MKEFISKSGKFRGIFFEEAAVELRFQDFVEISQMDKSRTGIRDGRHKI